MFVSREKYKQAAQAVIALADAFNELTKKHTQLLNEWNELVALINEKGGQAFLEGSKDEQLSDEDIQKLILLCHPDKHGGKPIASEMTRKLLEIREFQDR